MSDDNIPRMPSPSIREQFRKAAKKLGKSQVTPQIDTNQEYQGGKKSSAQVERVVRQQAVRQFSGGLKPNISRPYKLSTRVSEDERNTLVGHAEKACLTLSEFIRLSLLKSPALDPARNRLLLKANYELTRQGTNLNQIARQLNGGSSSPFEAESSLAGMAVGMAQAYAALHDALTHGRVQE